jgi:hypothetical protein
MAFVFYPALTKAMAFDVFSQNAGLHIQSKFNAGNTKPLLSQ